MTSALKMGSDESHFNVSVGSDGQSHKTVSTNHNFSEEKGELKGVSNRGPSAYQPNALPLSQTGSRKHVLVGPTYLYSVDTHHRNLLKSLVTTSRVTYAIPRAHTGNCVNQN